jgi:iduronate 2-sulfatase
MFPITRRGFAASLAGWAALPGAAAPARKTNVLFIAVDDLRPQLGCYGHSRIKSPHIDRLASQGMRFDRAYCQQAVCAPTRVSLLTGARPDTTQVHDLQTPLNTVRPDLLSIPHHFRNNGYETISLGKIYHHADEDPQGWSARPWHPRGAWAGRGYLDPASIAAMEKNDAALKAESRPAARSGLGPAYEGPDVPDNAYADGLTCEKAVAELNRLRDKPFFLAAGFLKPHLPFNAPKKYWDLYSPGDLELPSRNRMPENMPKVAGTDWGELRGYPGIPKTGPVDEATMRRLIHGYYACVSYVDAQVGRLLRELDRLGLRENTAVILWGDHGWKLGDYGAWCKHTNFEIDARVPLILSLPGRKNAGAAAGALVEFVDVYPTLAEACGLEIPAHCEGKSMTPLFDNPRRKWKAAAFSQYPRGGGVMGYSMRTERWRYTEWIARKTGEVTARELYDHSTGDIASTNLADRPDMAATVRDLSAMLDKGRGWRRVRERAALPSPDQHGPVLFGVARRVSKRYPAGTLDRPHAALL